MSSILAETPQAAARRLSAKALQSGHIPAGLHEYRDVDGKPVFWRIRCKHPDTGGKWIRPMHWNGHDYTLGEPLKPDTGSLLYRLPELLADITAPVWVVEGETCADALVKAGRLATTSGSSSSADGADWTPLRGRRVMVWPDHDEAGRKYADAVTTRLQSLGCMVQRIDVAALGLPDKGDCVDWLQSHSAAELDQLPMASMAPPAPDDTPRVELIRGSDITPEPIDWLWQGWLAAGKLHLIGGQPGTGKTTIATTLAATVTMGGQWPDGSRAERGSVVIWSGEDDPRDTLIPRLRAAGADMTRVRIVNGIRDGADRYPFDPASDCGLLAAQLANITDLRLLVIDPIVSAVAGDSHKNAEVRRGLQPLVDLAQRHRCALLGVTHFTKGTAGREPVERITGSLAFGALARVVLVTSKSEAADDKPATRFLARAKSNIGPDGSGFTYDLQQRELPGHPGIMASSVMWGAALEGSARELLAEAENREDNDPANDASSFLRDLLADGSMPAREVFKEAGNAGFSKDSMHRAKRKIGVVAVKQSMSGGWTWRLSRGEGSAEDGEGGAQNCSPSSLPSGDEARI